MTTYRRRLRTNAKDVERERGSRPEEATVVATGSCQKNTADSSPRPSEGEIGTRGSRVSDRTPDAARQPKREDEDRSGRCGAEIPCRGDMPCMAERKESGTVCELEGKMPELGFELECHRCGTVVQMVAPRCPICGQRFESGHMDLAELLAAMQFDSDSCPEEDCPSCGEHVSLAEGVCPACGENVWGNENKVLPVVVKGEDVVFMCLDVMTGELSYLRRLAGQRKLDQISLHLGSGAREKSAPGV